MTFTYSRTYDGPYSEAVPSVTNVSECSGFFCFKVSAPFHEDAIGLFRINMQKAKAPAVVVPTLESMTYDPHTTLADIPLTGGWECVTGSTVPTAAQTDYPLVLAVDDGNYDYTGVEGDANHNDSDPASVVAKIAKAPISPTLSISGWTYGDEADAPALKGNPGKGAVTFQYSDAKKSTKPTKPTSVHGGCAAAGRITSAAPVRSSTPSPGATPPGGVTQGL